MSRRPPAGSLLVLFILTAQLATIGCGKRQKKTADLIADLKSPDDKARLVAVRLLPQRKGEASAVVPALAEAMKDSEADVRISAAIGLGQFGQEAKEAIPALETALNDRDARVREAAWVALTRIGPDKYPSPPKRNNKGNG